jgi:inosine-uridine nucleoside N-ribohydrolase
MRRRENAIAFAGAFDLPLPSGPSAVKHGGVDFLIRTVEAAPGSVTILAIGPLTNLAIALRRRPGLASKIGSLVIMGGNVHVPGNASPKAEFNFWFDPEAAQSVLRSAIPRKTLFALDVCNQITLTKQIFDQIVAVKTPITDLYREDFGYHFPGFLKDPHAVGSLWDELAAAWVINPAVATRTESLWLDVEATFNANYGAVKPLDRALAPHATPVSVVLGMDFPRALELYKAALTAR